MILKDRESIREFLKENGIRDLLGLQQVIKQMTGVLIEEILEAERDEFLGYQRYQRKDEKNGNSRNGYSQKRVRSSFGEIELKIPRDRKGEFEPKLIGKYQKDISQIEDSIISMYAKGMTVREIQDHLQQIYGMDLSPQSISNITDRILPVIEEWRNRPLQEIYTMLFIDGIQYKVREDGRIKSKALYSVIGINLEGKKEILGLWIMEREDAKGWLRVLGDLKNRGVKEILIITSDDLPGVEEAIRAVYPDAEYQGCVVHLIRNSLKYVSYKDRKEFVRDMKEIYKAPNEEGALAALQRLEEKWAEKYPLAVKVWQRGFDRIRTMYRFTPEIRRLIYTTNMIENYHGQLRKVTDNRRVFPNDESVIKLVGLVSMQIERRWAKSKVRSWNMILAQLAIHFQDRLEGYLWNGRKFTQKT